MLGPRLAQQHADKLGTLSDTLFYTVTTVAGTQTMGEEYCDIMQFCERTGSFPTLGRRLLLVALQIFGQGIICALLRHVAPTGDEPKS